MKATKHKDAPERQCIVSRESGDKQSLIRFVCDPSGRVVPDVGEKLPGRGMWVRCSQGVLRKAIASKAFSKAAKRQLNVPEGLVVLVASLLYQRAFSALSMARKAGDVVSGYEKVLSAIASGEVVAVLHASDAGADGRSKLAHGGDWLVSEAFSRDDLCQVTARDNVAHLAVLGGKAGQQFVNELRRFSGFMEEAPL